MSQKQPRNFEEVLHVLHKQYITPPKHEVKRNNKIMTNLLRKLINEMKRDKLFASLYKRIFHGGSQFDGLKVGSPDEYDLDILLRVPRGGKPILNHSNEPGFVWVEFDSSQNLSEEFRGKFVDEKNHLCANKVQEWMISLVTKATNKFQINGGMTFKIAKETLTGWINTSGPAVTLHLECKEFSMSIDLVPCFEFSTEDWPTGGYRPNPVPSVNTFFIVPKMPKNQYPPERYWRLSFQEQERQIIHDKQCLKPTLRLLKMLRNEQGHDSIASYYLKTIFLWAEDTNGASYWYGSLTNVFFKLLEDYIQYIEKDEIPYFWNKRNNLLNISTEEQENMANRLRKMQKDLVDNYKTNPFVIYRYLNIKL